MTAASPNEDAHTIMVILMGVSLGARPSKIWKGASGKQGRVEVYTGMLGIFNCRILQACRVFC